MSESSQYLDNIISSQLPHLETLARGWLACGASSFSISEHGRVLASWPESSQDAPVSVTANIELGNVNIARLNVGGAGIQFSEERLHADARLLSKLIQQEMELNNLATELIYTRDQMLAFFNLTRATRNNLDIDQSLKQLAYEASWLLKSEAAFVYLETGENQWYSTHFPRQILNQRMMDACLGRYISSGKKLLHIRRGELGLYQDMQNILLVPIRSRDIPLAVLGVVNKLAGEFMSQDIKFVKAIAEFAGAHLENMVLFQSRIQQAELNAEMKLANHVQTRLLPELPQRVKGIDLWATSRPASHIGGDFYDFIERNSDSLSMVVGDVSGKGMPAALLVAMTRTVIRSEILGMPVPSPQSIISASNEKLYDDFTDVSMFATLFMGHYDSQMRQMNYVNAGHSPVVFAPAGGQAQLVEADVTAIGILPSNCAKERKIDIHEGDVVVIGSDGLNNASNSQDQQFGYDRFVDLVDNLADKPAQQIAEGLFNSIDDFSNGASQADDQTLVVIKGVSN